MGKITKILSNLRDEKDKDLDNKVGPGNIVTKKDKKEKKEGLEVTEKSLDDKMVGYLNKDK